MKIGRKGREEVIGACESEKREKTRNDMKKNGKENGERNAKEDMEKLM